MKSNPHQPNGHCSWPEPSQSNSISRPELSRCVTDKEVASIRHDCPMPLSFFEARYQINRATLWRYRRAGLPAIGVGARVFIRETDFVAFLERMNLQVLGATIKDGGNHEC